MAERNTLVHSFKAHSRPVRSAVLSLSYIIMHTQYTIILFMRLSLYYELSFFLCSDVGWSFTDPNLLASCAMDSFINIWDIRYSLYIIFSVLLILHVHITIPTERQDEPKHTSRLL